LLTNWSFIWLESRFKATDANKLRAEYNRLVDGLAQSGHLPSEFSSPLIAALFIIYGLDYLDSVFKVMDVFLVIKYRTPGLQIQPCHTTFSRRPYLEISEGLIVFSLSWGDLCGS
jgi:hypothetical protein